MLFHKGNDPKFKDSPKFFPLRSKLSKGKCEEIINVLQTTSISITPITHRDGTCLWTGQDGTVQDMSKDFSNVRDIGTLTSRDFKYKLWGILTCSRGIRSYPVPPYVIVAHQSICLSVIDLLLYAYSFFTLSPLFLSLLLFFSSFFIFKY